MSSPPLADRLADQFRQIVMEMDPELPKDMVQGRVKQYVSRAVLALRGYVSELEAEASATNDYPRSSALGDLFDQLATK